MINCKIYKKPKMLFFITEHSLKLILSISNQYLCTCKDAIQWRPWATTPPLSQDKFKIFLSFGILRTIDYIWLVFLISKFKDPLNICPKKGLKNRNKKKIYCVLICTKKMYHRFPLHFARSSAVPPNNFVISSTWICALI